MNKSKFFEPLAVLVASGRSIRDASTDAGCSESTAYSISADRDFKQRVSEIRAEITFQAVGQLADAATQAAATLRELLDPSNEPAVRLNAAKAILAALPSISDFGELRKRVNDLESSQHLRVAQ